jgi:hypothetical protein
LEERIIEILKKFRIRNLLDEDHPTIVFPEPYLPYIPKNWNGILVLAEAQNLALRSQSYIDRLQLMSIEDQINRLIDPDDLGVEPWDNGHIKLAVKALYPKIDIYEVGIGNAVPWSARENRRNVNPTNEMLKYSIRYWDVLFDKWELLKDLKQIIVCGAKARYVIRNSINNADLELRLPSPNAIGRVCGMFEKKDLLNRYPEVLNAMKALSIQEEELGLSQVFFACHAVSLNTKGKN